MINKKNNYKLHPSKIGQPTAIFKKSMTSLEIGALPVNINLTLPPKISLILKLRIIKI